MKNKKELDSMADKLPDWFKVSDDCWKRIKHGIAQNRAEIPNFILGGSILPLLLGIDYDKIPPEMLENYSKRIK